MVEIRRKALAMVAFFILAIGMVSAGASPGLAGSARLDSATTRAELAGTLEVLRDPTGALTIEQVRAAGTFSPLPSYLTAGFDLSAFWLRFTVERADDAPSDWLLEVEMPYLDHVDLYTPDGRGGVIVSRAGDRVAFSTRQIPYRTFVFRLDLPKPGRQQVYLRVQSTSAIVVAARIWQPAEFHRMAGLDSLAFGMTHGALMVVIVFALAQVLFTRDPVYLSFLLYVVFGEALFGALAGFASQYLFPTRPLLADGMVGFTVCCTIGLGALFAAKALDLDRHFPRIARLYGVGGYLCLLCSLSVFADRYYVVGPFVQAAALALLVSSAILAAIRSFRGDRGALCFLAAFAVHNVASGMMLVRVLGVQDTSATWALIAQGATAAHMLLLSFGLAQRSAGIDADRRKLQSIRLETARLSERNLEARVRQRTSELAAANVTLAAEITERRAAEERLREGERQVRAILDAAPFPMVVASYPDGRFMFLNQPATDLLNISLFEAGALRTTDFYINVSERKHFLMRLKETGCVLGAEFRVRRMPREQRWVLLSAVRFTYRDQDAVMICLNDISMRKQLEETLRLAGLRSEGALEVERQAMREQRNFLSMVSHEFRVPLAIIEASSQLLGIYTHADHEAEDEVAKIGRAVRRMSDLIDVCLADDRLDSTTLSLRISTVDLGRTLNELIEDKRPFASDRPMQVSIRGESALIDADATLLRVAFSNLIDNALKFSPAGSAIEVEIGVDESAAQVQVTDHGPGIAQEEQPRIFEKFYRSTKADRVRGAGLGLYIVRRIIDLHGGSIAVDSLPDKGATFVVWLPLTPPDSEEKARMRGDDH